MTQSDKTKQFLRELAHELKTQDNACTADPVYLVMEKRRLYGVAPEFYEDAGLAVYRDEITLHEGEEGYEEALNDMTLDGDGYQIHWISQDVPVAFFLTRKAAQEYVDTQSYRHRYELFVWVDSAVRNFEIKALRKAVMEMGDD